MLEKRWVAVQNRRNDAGFTLVETMGAVAIIVVLFALIFVNVISYQRSMEQLKLDETAKELFIAAQNHLTMADSMGLLAQKDEDGAAKYDEGTEDTSSGENDVYYFMYPAVNHFSAEDDDSDSDDPEGDDPESDGPDSGNPTSVLDLMLPYGSIDEIVRAGNSFVIKYQKASGLVLEVFYAETTGKFAHEFQESEYSGLPSGANNSEQRKNYGSDDSVIGWYGGEGLEVRADKIQAPDIKVINEEQLLVKIINRNNESDKPNAELKIIVTGVTSKAKKTFILLKYDSSSNEITAVQDYIDLRGSYNKDFVVVLDDVTNINDNKNQHFCKLLSTADVGTFIPGENIRIQAIAYDSKKLSNIAKSATKITNSLFGSLKTVTTSSGGVQSSVTTAGISNFRHLENLDKTISNVGVDSLKLQNAEQRANMDWTGFWNYDAYEGQSGLKITTKDGDGATGAKKYCPVTPGYALSYNGKGHKISNVDINYAGPSGLFGALGKTDTNVSVKDVELIDFNVVATSDDAGALAGKLINVNVENVVAYNTKKDDSGLEIKAPGTTGGLIGSMQGGKLESNAAALYVNSTGSSAGGLVGLVSGSSTVAISKCYSGGHTVEGKYLSSTTEGQAGRLNVRSTAESGGLIGKATSGVTVSNCYSTCSAYGATVGGLVGSVSTGSIKNSYSLGFVSGVDGSSKVGLFIGAAGDSFEFKNTDENYYFEIGSAAGTNPRGDKDEVVGITAADANTTTYRKIAAGTGNLKPAVPYDSVLAEKYNNTYPYKTSAAIHHGDWPMYETFVINTKSQS